MRWFLAALLFSGSLWSDLGDHLKKIDAKPEGLHTMRNIDFIYMINLDQRPEKWNRSVQQLELYGIVPFRFSAVNGWELSLKTIRDVGLKFSPEMQGGFYATSYHTFDPSHEIMGNVGQTYFCHCLARGTIGIALSHISILQDAYDSNYETIWVMEDDVDVIRDPRSLSDLIERLDQAVGADGWDLLFTDRDLRDRNGNYKASIWAARRPDFIDVNDYTLRQYIGSEFFRVGARYGAHSMIVRRSGIAKLLKFFKAHQIFLPYDLDYILPPGIKLFAVLEDVVSNLCDALSDNGGPNYLHLEKK